MAIFKCDSCGYERDVPDKLTGKKAKCPDCGHGVTITDSISDDSVDELFGGSDAVPEDEIDVVAGDPDGIPMDSIDLDQVDTTIDLGEDTTDIICTKCGHVLDAVHDGMCPECGAKISATEELPEPTEDNVDLSDLAEEDSPQVWEADYPGNQDDADTSFVDKVEDKSSFGLFEGNLALNLYSGLVSGLLGIFFSVAIALLAVSPQGLHEYLPYVLSMSLTGMAVSMLLYPLGSRIPFGLAGPETVLAAVLFFYLGSIYNDMSGQYPDEAVAVTIMAGTALSSIVVGFTLWLIGRLKAGEYVRYIPLHIIGGVIGGIGLFIFLGTLDWIGPKTVDWGNLPLALSNVVNDFAPMLYLDTMGPSVMFGLILFWGLRRYKNSLFMVGLLLVGAAAGYGAGFWGEKWNITSLAMNIPYLEEGLPPLSAKVIGLGFEDIQWGVIKNNGLYIGALIALSALTSMYRVTGLEMVQGREADLNVEFRSLGLSNLASGLAGGMVANISYGRSAGAYYTGARGPVSGIVGALVCCAGIYFADYYIQYIPRFVPEGLLIFSGLALVRDWLFKSRTAFTRKDDVRMMWMTFFVTVLLGILAGIGFGVALALMVTVSRSSKGGVVRNILSGVNHRSNVDRAPAQSRTLKEFGDHIYILRLQGFLSLGSMTRLLKDIQARLDDKDILPVEYLLLDFKLVTGIASAAGIGFDKLHNLINSYGIELIITSPPLELEEHLEKSGHVGGEEEDSFRVFFNLDFALEWCENHVLDSENMLEMKSMTLPELLTPVFPEPKYIPALMKVLKRIKVEKGTTVFRQGDASESMYFVESGRLDVELELEGGKVLRLKKIGAGAVFGEMGIYTMAPRSATIRATETCVLYRITTEKLDAIEKRAPMLVTAVNRFLINMLSERLGDANSKVRDLMT